MRSKTAKSSNKLCKNSQDSSSVKIFNLHSNSAKEVTDLQLVSYEEYGKDGLMQDNKYVKYTVVGHNRTWPDFMPVKDFKKLNPDVQVEGLN